jgi:DNA-binding NtrC family response regulator
VIVLTGFATRETVATAKSSGAFACLDLPCDLEDLLDLVERVADSGHSHIRFDHSHELPPPARAREDIKAPQRNVHTAAWPETERSSTISRIG